MRIGVVGAGAMGGFYGALLAQAGEDVRFLMRRDYDAVRRDGLRVLSPMGDFHLRNVKCYRSVEQMGPVELVFVGLKTTANQYYQELIGPLMGSETLVLTAQNGLGNEDRLAELFGPERVAGGLAFLCCNRGAPGVIEHLDYSLIHIGNFRRDPDEKLQRFGQMLRDSGLECVVVDNLELSRWKKLTWNVPFNGLSAAFDKTVDYIVRDRKLRGLAQRLMKEVQTAAEAYELVIEDEFLDKMMYYSDRLKPYFTSMHLDRRNHRPMELESIIGEPLRRAQKKGLQLPEMRRLYEEPTKLDREVV